MKLENNAPSKYILDAKIERNTQDLTTSSTAVETARRRSVERGGGGGGRPRAISHGGEPVIEHGSEGIKRGGGGVSRPLVPSSAMLSTPAIDRGTLIGCLFLVCCFMGQESYVGPLGPKMILFHTETCIYIYI
jgi:hypothetical protein